jgi:hypothetical protein
VGDLVGDGPVDLVTDPGEYRARSHGDRGGDPLAVEGPIELLDGTFSL